MEIKKILVPIDFSDSSLIALKYSLNYATIFNAEIILIYVVEPIVYPPDFSLGQISIPSVEIEIDKKAKDELDKVANSIIPQEISFRTVVKTGKPFVEIIETARDENADLIIISTHGRSGVEHIFFGSTAEKVVRKAPCPVLSLRDSIKGFDIKKAID